MVDIRKSNYWAESEVPSRPNVIAQVGKEVT